MLAFETVAFLVTGAALASRTGDMIIGFGGGVLGGFAAIPGPLRVMWCGLRGCCKDEQRGVYQPFNQIIILIALAGYKRLDDAQFQHVALRLLPAGGLMLVTLNAFSAAKP